MSGPEPHFHLAGVPVRVQPWFFAIPVMGLLSQPGPAGIAWVFVVTVGVLWHEMGHALAMRAFGYAPRVELVAMGGLTYWPDGARPAAKAAFLVSLAGPVAGLLLGGATWLVAERGPWSPLAETVLFQSYWVNVIWSLVNLLPVIPLDGSALMDHGSRLLGGPERPRWVGALSLVVGAAGAVVAFRYGMVWGAMIGAFGAAAGWSRWQGDGSPREAAPVARRPNPWEGEPAKLRAARQAAHAAAERGDRLAVIAELQPFVRSDRLEAADLALLASALVAGGDAATLRTLCLDRLGASPGESSTTMLVSSACEELVEAGRLDEAGQVRRAAFEATGAPYHAWEAALCLARLGQADEAVAWLERSLDAGLQGAPALLADPALEPLRGHAGFARLAERAGAGAPSRAPRPPP